MTTLADDIVEVLMQLDACITRTATVIAAPETSYTRRLTQITELQSLVDLRNEVVRFDEQCRLQRDTLLERVRRRSRADLDQVATMSRISGT